MDTVIRVRDLSPDDVADFARALRLQRDLSPNAEVIVRDDHAIANDLGPTGDDGVPLWCTVLEGFSDEDLAEFDALLTKGVQFGTLEE